MSFLRLSPALSPHLHPTWAEEREENGDTHEGASSGASAPRRLLCEAVASRVRVSFCLLPSLTTTSPLLLTPSAGRPYPCSSLRSPAPAQGLLPRLVPPRLHDPPTTEESKWEWRDRGKQVGVEEEGVGGDGWCKLDAARREPQECASTVAIRVGNTNLYWRGAFCHGLKGVSTYDISGHVDETPLVSAPKLNRN
jgi:hypothetical protein